MTILEIRDLLIRKFNITGDGLCHLDKYLDICENGIGVGFTKNSGREKHHILMKSLFPEYKDFSNNAWNKAVLSSYDHFWAHVYLARATNDNKAWSAVHGCINGKTKNWSMSDIRKLNECDLNELAEIYCRARDHHAAVASQHNKKRWAALTEEDRGELGRKISDSQKGKVIPDEIKRSMSFAARGESVLFNREDVYSFAISVCLDKRFCRGKSQTIGPAKLQELVNRHFDLYTSKGDCTTFVKHARKVLDNKEVIGDGRFDIDIIDTDDIFEGFTRNVGVQVMESNPLFSNKEYYLAAMAMCFDESLASCGAITISCVTLPVIMGMEFSDGIFKTSSSEGFIRHARKVLSNESKPKHGFTISDIRRRIDPKWNALLSEIRKRDISAEHKVVLKDGHRKKNPLTGNKSMYILAMALCFDDRFAAKGRERIGALVLSNTLNAAIELLGGSAMKFSCNTLLYKHVPAVINEEEDIEHGYTMSDIINFQNSDLYKKLLTYIGAL